MFKARAVVLAGVVVVPALAVAGMSRLGVSLPSIFSKRAIVSSEISITAPVAQQFGVQVARPGSSKGEQAVDVIDAARMREALTRIVEGASRGVVQDTKAAMTFSDDQEPQSVDRLREALGVVVNDESDLRLTQNVTSVDAASAEPSNDGLLLNDDSTNAGAFGGGQSLADALFPSIAARNLTGSGVQQGGQAPLVQRLAGGNSGFSGNDSSGSNGRAASSLDVEPSDIASNGDDVPAPGAVALGLIGLAFVARRRS
ncbi:MAG: hypothetical protein JNK58_11045 [Phycisphaerae bacterium]|nr:hypothetical protein [Phycisphaerae bacterium]